MSEAKRTSARIRAKPAADDAGKGRARKRKKGAGKKAQRHPPKMNPLGQALEAVAKKFAKAGGTKLLLTAFPYLLFGYLGDKIAHAYRMADAQDFFSRLIWGLANLGTAFDGIMPSFHPADQCH